MTFGFASPWLLSLLVIVPLLAAMPYWSRTRKNWRPAGLRYADNELIAPRNRSWRLTVRPLLTVARLLAIALVIVALARPQSGQAREIITGEGVDIALALDISSSMGSLDLADQNRLEVSKEVIRDFIAEREYDRLGLVVFAHSAFLQSPPTLDHGVLTRSVEDSGLAPEIGIRDGTAIGLGLATAANMLKDSEAQSKVVILLTDGVNNAGEIDPLTAAEAANALGIKVYTIGAGRPGLVPVRVPNGSFGDRIIYQQSELDEETLREIADITGGLFFRATDAKGLREVYDEINSLEKSDVEVITFSQHQELAAWLIIPVLGFLALELGLRNSLLRRIP